jgi:hypothetical protein
MCRVWNWILTSGSTEMSVSNFQVSKISGNVVEIPAWRTQPIKAERESVTKAS